MAVADYSEYQHTEAVDRYIVSPFGVAVKHRKEILLWQKKVLTFGLHNI